jgi:hypothetical protein
MLRRGRNSLAVLEFDGAGRPRPRTTGRKGDARMMNSPRLRSLEDKHAVLERQIDQQDARPKPDELELMRLKREKLRLREEIERLRRTA